MSFETRLATLLIWGNLGLTPPRDEYAGEVGDGRPDPSLEGRLSGCIFEILGIERVADPEPSFDGLLCSDGRVYD